MPAKIIPTLRYREAPAAIDWLCRAFGFERHAVYEDGEGGIAHAQLTIGDSMIMLGTLRDDAFGKLQGPAMPTATQSAYVVVPDADTHHARAVSAGAKVVYALKDEDYGGRGYSCHDLEGHLWTFGTYDPWATKEN